MYKDEQAISTLLFNTFESNNKLLICGNGGSASDCNHIVGELLKSFTEKREKNKKCDVDAELYSKLEKGFKAISLTANNAIMTAIGNDIGYDYVFAQQIYSLGDENDVLIAISTSGKSISVQNAIKVAKGIGMKVVYLSGNNIDKTLKKDVDLFYKTQSNITSTSQEEMLRLYHKLCFQIDEKYKNR